ncbi:MAG: hypothetical protein HGA75_13155 [Thiobacillus sp.]|nr:hypothetical protein [Thiobacillus sp.]
MLPYVRHFAAQGESAWLDWLAVLGEESDLGVLMDWVRRPDLGVMRARLLGRFGHPVAIEALLALMQSPDVALAVAAGESFALATGSDVQGARVELPVAADADEFEREFAPKVWLPDLDKARKLWSQRGGTWKEGRRWSRGYEVSGPCSPELVGQVDMQARWEIGVRSALAGNRLVAPPPPDCHGPV